MSANGHMSEAAVTKRLAEMNAIVRTAGHKFHKGAANARDGSPVDWNNPLDELIAREESARVDAAEQAIESMAAGGAELPLWIMERVKAAALEQFEQFESTLMEWLFAAGPHPLEVMRRLFAYAKQKRASLLWNMGFRQLGRLLGESHENARLRCEVLFGAMPAGWKKDRMACARMAESARGNNNRNGGKKARPRT